MVGVVVVPAGEEVHTDMGVHHRAFESWVEHTSVVGEVDMVEQRKQELWAPGRGLDTDMEWDMVDIGEGGEVRAMVVAVVVHKGREASHKESSSWVVHTLVEEVVGVVEGALGKDMEVLHTALARMVGHTPGFVEVVVAGEGVLDRGRAVPHMAFASSVEGIHPSRVRDPQSSGFEHNISQTWRDTHIERLQYKNRQLKC